MPLLKSIRVPFPFLPRLSLISHLHTNTAHKKTHAKTHTQTKTKA
jgi:hypothetical protein